VAPPAKISLVLVAGYLLSALTPRQASAQHITIDGRLSPAQTLIGPNYTIGANLGKQVGSNLFQSFGIFGLATGETATFTGNAGSPSISNVIGRVTGGNPSSINGAIRTDPTTLQGSNLYLINPSGMVFGPNATVNVSGSFHAATADYLKMSDGAKLQATNPGGSTLSAAPPAAFGFLTASPAQISVNGSTLGPVPGTLGLVGGPVSITGGMLSAPAGTIHVTSTAGIGEVPVDPRNTSALTVTSFGPVGLSGNSKLDVSNPNGLGSGGSVFIHSGALTISASEINADNYGSGSGGTIALRGDGQVALTNSANVHAVAYGSGSGAGLTIATAPGGLIQVDASTVELGTLGSGAGGPLMMQTGQLTLTNGAALTSMTQATGNGGPIAISAASLLLDGGSTQNRATGIFSTTTSTAANAGSGGTISIATGEMALHNGANVLAGSCITPTCGQSGVPVGMGGGVTVSVGGPLTIDSGASLGSVASGTGNAGSVSVSVAGPLAIDMSVGAVASILDGIGSLTLGRGNAGNVTVAADALTLTHDGLVSSVTEANGNSGSVSIDVSQTLSIYGSGGVSGLETGILGDTYSAGRGGDVTVSAGGITIAGGACADRGSCFGAIASDVQLSAVGQPSAIGDAGRVTVGAGSISIAGLGEISSSTFGAGSGGTVSINVAGGLTIDGMTAPGPGTGILSQANSRSAGNAGTVNVSAGSITIANSGGISGGTFGPGNGGSVSVKAVSGLTIDGALTPGFFTGINSQANQGSTGNAGPINISAGGISLANQGMISSLTFCRGNAGQITVAAGALSITSNGEILSGTVGRGAGGSVAVSVTGQLAIDGAQGDPSLLTGISTQSQGGGDAGTVFVTAGTLSMAHTGVISSTTFAEGKGGSVAVTVDGALTIDGSGTNPDVVATGIVTNSEAGSSGNAGDVAVAAGTLSILNGGGISSALRTFMNLPPSTANSGRVTVDVGGLLSMSGSESRIGTETSPGSPGNGGSVTVNAAQIALTNGGEIVSTTAGTGAGGSVNVTTPGALVLDGMGVSGTQIAASATGAQSGAGGSVTVEASSLSVQNGGQIASTAGGLGKGGDVGVTIAGDVSLSGVAADGTPSQISAAATPGSVGSAGQVILTAGGALNVSGGAEISSATAGQGNGGMVTVSSQEPLSVSGGRGILALASATASGNAGSVAVNAPQITLASSAEIASTTAGTGAGGPVAVMTPGTLALAGGAQIAASATGPQSGAGGSVTVTAGNLSLQGGAQIASSTAGPGKGGDVDITVVSDIVLPDPGSQITAMSTGSGDAGSVTVSAGSLLIANGAAISTEAETSRASGGNITLQVGDFLYLKNGEISTSVKGETGNGGNITIDPQYVVLDQSSIIAQAIEGHGGNITINAGEFLQSADSVVSATSALGISGTIEIIGPRVDLNGALVVLSSELRNAAQVLRNSCATQAGLPQSSLVDTGRGGLPQDPDATLPALYIAGRDMSPTSPAAPGPPPPIPAQQTTARLTMHCS
jgi:filamentous hemagglutinin family protein